MRPLRFFFERIAIVAVVCNPSDPMLPIQVVIRQCSSRQEVQRAAICCKQLASGWWWRRAGTHTVCRVSQGLPYYAVHEPTVDVRRASGPLHVWQRRKVASFAVPRAKFAERKQRPRAITHSAAAALSSFHATGNCGYLTARGLTLDHSYQPMQSRFCEH